MKRRVLLGNYNLTAGRTEDFFVQAQKVRRICAQEYRCGFCLFACLFACFWFPPSLPPPCMYPRLCAHIPPSINHYVLLWHKPLPHFPLVLR